MSIFYLALAIAIWGIVHSILASNSAKDFFRGVFGSGFMRIYRLSYNVFAVLSFLPILYLMVALPDRPLYSVASPWNLLMPAGQGLAALLLLAALLQTDTLSFVGLRQLFEEEKPGQLTTRGLYRYIRHPLYTFSLLFLWLTPTVTLNSFTVYAAATVYILVGAYFEERKLLREFGQTYADYKRVTPMLIPGLKL
ncbi:MAG: isoprenylcysteine carboxylmethyltransferase family protein [Chloroflexi bacterium]|nr:isoprenylcysteine carboxylmethyltransferase family protein [Chloroflexota bacterium]